VVVVSGSAIAGAGFPKSRRVRKRSEYLRVQSGGRKLQTPSFLVFVLASAPSSESTGTPPARFGITVTRKIGGAVVRNRIKRLVREAVRRHASWFPSGRDVVLVALRGAAELGQADVERELETLCSRHFNRR
jgi:ribonuclease P protein component